MKRAEIDQVLKKLDNHGIFAFSYHDLKKWFLHEDPQTFKASLNRLTQQRVLEHLCHNVYLNPNAKSKDNYTLEHIAKILRKGEYNYLSLESLLSEIGLISQVPLSLLTVMSTGRSQRYHTLYGDIEFIHTKRSVSDILDNTYKTADRPLRLATQKTALRDLKRVNRNLHLVENIDQNDD